MWSYREQHYLETFLKCRFPVPILKYLIRNANVGVHNIISPSLNVGTFIPRRITISLSENLQDILERSHVATTKNLSLRIYEGKKFVSLSILQVGSPASSQFLVRALGSVMTWQTSRGVSKHEQKRPNQGSLSLQQPAFKVTNPILRQ